jgi:hypothetical protein
MKRAILLAAFALLPITSTSSAQQVSPPAPCCGEYPAVGRLCGYTADAGQEPGWESGVVDAGPFAVLEEHDLTEVFCTLQVDIPTHQGYYYSGARESAGGVGLVVMEQRSARVAVASTSAVFLCAEIWIYHAGHKTLYWNDTESSWSTDPAVPCARVRIGTV